MPSVIPRIVKIYDNWFYKKKQKFEWEYYLLKTRKGANPKANPRRLIPNRNGDENNYTNSHSKWKIEVHIPMDNTKGI
jgi:hypothetical protein